MIRYAVPILSPFLYIDGGFPFLLSFYRLRVRVMNRPLPPRSSTAGSTSAPQPEAAVGEAPRTDPVVAAQSGRVEALLPAWTPDAIRSRATGRNALLAVLLVGLVVASAFGETDRYVESAVMLGLPILVMVKLAQRRIKASGLDTVSSASLRARSRTDTLLWAGTAAVRSLPRFGGGFYGLVATLTFVGYQIGELGSAEWLSLDRWNDLFVQASADPFGFLTGTVALMLWDMALPISETWIRGAVYAVVWPFLLLQWGGFWALGIAIAGGVLYARLIPRLWPVVLARAATRNARIAPKSASPPSTDASADTHDPSST